MYLHILNYIHKLWGEIIVLLTKSVSPDKDSFLHQTLVRLLDLHGQFLAKLNFSKKPYSTYLAGIPFTLTF